MDACFGEDGSDCATVSSSGRMAGTVGGPGYGS